MTLKRSDYQGSIGKSNIHGFIDSGEDEKAKQAVQKIQALKEDMTARIMTNFKPVDSREIANIEEIYLEVISQLQDIDPKYNKSYSKNLKKAFEQMSKPEKLEGQKLANYVKKTEELEILYSKYGDKSKHELEVIMKRSETTPKIKNEIQRYLYLSNPRNIENTKSKTIHFDIEIYNQYTQDNNKPLNIPCFYEEDLEGNRHYFSINALLNDIQTFGIECGLPKLGKEGIPDGLKGKFPSLDRRIKHAIVKHLLYQYRDYQETIMYGFVDYDKEKETRGSQNGMLAEQFVEWSFRELANHQNEYNIKVEKASIGEDQEQKIDLIIIIEHKKTGINISKQLQLTLNQDESVLAKKRRQIQSANRKYHDINVELLKLELADMRQKLSLWRSNGRAIGYLGDLMTIDERELLTTTFNRIIQESQAKQKLAA